MSTFHDHIEATLFIHHAGLEDNTPEDQRWLRETVATLWYHVFTRGQFWPSGIVVACVCVSVSVCVCQSRACPHDNSPLVQARITRFGTKVQKTLVNVPLIFWDDQR